MEMKEMVVLGHPPARQTPLRPTPATHRWGSSFAPCSRCSSTGGIGSTIDGVGHPGGCWLAPGSALPGPRSGSIARSTRGEPGAIQPGAMPRVRIRVASADPFRRADALHVDDLTR